MFIAYSDQLSLVKEDPVDEFFEFVKRLDPDCLIYSDEYGVKALKLLRVAAYQNVNLK